MSKKTVVIGASPKTNRYSNKAVRLLKQNGYDVLPLGYENDTIDGIAIDTSWKTYDAVDTVTLYLNPVKQKQYYDYIISLQPKRIIFNPGTENTELQQLANQNNIQTLEACTLVLLNTGQY